MSRPIGRGARLRPGRSISFVRDLGVAGRVLVAADMEPAAEEHRVDDTGALLEGMAVGTDRYVHRLEVARALEAHEPLTVGDRAADPFGDEHVEACPSLGVAHDLHRHVYGCAARLQLRRGADLYVERQPLREEGHR